MSTPVAIPEAQLAACEFIRLSDDVRLVQQFGGTPGPSQLYALILCRERLDRALYAADFEPRWRRYWRRRAGELAGLVA